VNRCSKASRYAYFLAALCSIAIPAAANPNVELGDVDYPKQNPTPSHFFTFHGTIDPSLDIHFSTTWVANERTDRTCRYTINESAGASMPFFVRQSLPVERRGDRYTVRIAADAMTPGRCGWVFNGVRIVTTGQRLVSGRYVVNGNSLELKPGTSPNGVLDLDCGTAMFVGELVIQCLNSDPNHRVDNSLWWYPETTDIEIRFHPEQKAPLAIH
jgi:hypothetical protein